MSHKYATSLSDASHLTSKQQKEVEMIISAATLLGCTVMETLNDDTTVFFRIGAPDNAPKHLAVVFKIKETEHWIDVFNNMAGVEDFEDISAVNFQEAYDAVTNYFKIS